MFDWVRRSANVAPGGMEDSLNLGVGASRRRLRVKWPPRSSRDQRRPGWLHRSWAPSRRQAPTVRSRCTPHFPAKGRPGGVPCCCAASTASADSSVLRARACGAGPGSLGAAQGMDGASAGRYRGQRPVCMHDGRVRSALIRTVVGRGLPAHVSGTPRRTGPIRRIRLSRYLVERTTVRRTHPSCFGSCDRPLRNIRGRRISVEVVVDIVLFGNVHGCSPCTSPHPPAR